MAKLTPGKKKLLDDALAAWLVYDGIPFAVAESEYLRHLLNDLRPGYKPPSRKKLNILRKQMSKQEHDIVVKVLATACSSAAISFDGKFSLLKLIGVVHLFWEILIRIPFFCGRF